MNPEELMGGMFGGMMDNNQEQPPKNSRSKVVLAFGIFLILASFAIVICYVLLVKSFILSLIANNIIIAIFKLLLVIIMIMINIFLLLFGLYVVYDSKI